MTREQSRALLRSVFGVTILSPLMICYAKCSWLIAAGWLA